MRGDGRVWYAYDNGLHVSELRARALRKEQSEAVRVGKSHVGNLPQ